VLNELWRSGWTVAEARLGSARLEEVFASLTEGAPVADVVASTATEQAAS
jgi:hypothetical protein